MLTVGLTGGSGSGKGYVAALLAKAGIPSMDTDAVYHSMCHRETPCMSALAARFGEEIFLADGTLNRKVLANIVFSDPEALNFLNRTTHKFILEECEIWLHAQSELGSFAAVIDAPLLFESGFNQRCDLIVSVTADDEERIRRIVKRDKITNEEALRRISKQKSKKFFIENSDYVLYNNDSDMIERQVAALASDLKRRKNVKLR